MSEETKRTSEREAGLEGEARKGEAVEGEGAKAGEAVAVERESTDGGAEGEGAKAGEAVAAKPEKKPGRLQLLLQEAVAQAENDRGPEYRHRQILAGGGQHARLARRLAPQVAARAFAIGGERAHVDQSPHPGTPRSTRR